MNAAPKTRYLRLPFLFDVRRLECDLENIDEEMWMAHVNTTAYTGEWRCVPLRSVDGRSDHILSLSGMHYDDTAILERCTYFREVIDNFECEKLSVRLMAMAPGSRILMHRDHGTSFEDGVVRLHVPIITAPEVLFTVADEDVHFAAGHAWYLNANCPHGVTNESTRPRIHLMLDCIANPWLERVFMEAGFEPDEKPKYGDPSITDDNVAEVIAGLHALGTPAGRKLAAQMIAVREPHADS